MTESASAPNADNRQSQDVQIGRDFQVDGTGNQVDFSQTHIETQIIQHTSVAAVQSRPLIETSPYKGLKKFEATDRQRFFGRESLVTNLLTHLATHHCLIMLGASGSGKSSLVRAGIIPQLAEAEGTNLIDLTFTPDEDPFDSLYASLLAHFKQSEAKFARQSHADTLTQVVNQLKAPDTPWVIFVDQFEELFSITQTQKRETFIASWVKLQQMIAQAQNNKNRATPARSLYLIMAMRADFLEQFAPFQELGQITERYMRFITNMTREDLQRAIANPANLHGVAYQDGLLKEILNDLQDQPGELPLLQYTLDLLWKRTNLDERLICCDAYWSIEGVRGALRQHVTDIYNKLPEPDQTRARQIFLSLVDTSGRQNNPDGANKVVSRRAYLSQFTEPDIRRVLVHLINANLLVSNWRQEPSDAQAPTNASEQTSVFAQRDQSDDGELPLHGTVELAHETLIRAWPQLQTWLDENQEVINLKHRLSDEARHWYEVYQTQPQQATDELWRGSKLERVVELRQDGMFDSLFGGLEATEIQFIDTAVAERDRQQQEKEQQRQKELRLYRAVAISAIGAAAAFILGGTLATANWRTAQRREIEALITAAQAQFVDNPHSLDTLVAALEAGDRLQKSPWFRGNAELQSEALQVVSQAVYWVREQETLLGHSQFVQSVSVSPVQTAEDQLIATASADGTVRLWTAKGELRQTVQEQEQSFFAVQFSPDGSKLAMADRDGKVTLWDSSDDPNTIRLLDAGQNNHQGIVRHVSFDPSGLRLATASDDGTVNIWDVESGQLLKQLDNHNGNVFAAVYSADGRFLATGGTDQKVMMWDQTGELLDTLDSPSSVYGLSFSNGGEGLVEEQRLAIALSDGIVNIHQVETNGRIVQEPDLTLRGHNSSVTAVQFSSNDSLIATTSLDGSTKIWNRFGKELYTLKGHLGRVNDLAFDPTGTWLTTVSNDNTAKIWTLNSSHQQLLSDHAYGIYDVDFGANNLLATADTKGKLLLWDTTTLHEAPVQILQAGTTIYNVAISPQNDSVAAALRDGTVKIWPISLDGNVRPKPLSIPAHTDSSAAMDIQFSKDGNTLISVGFNGIIRFWQVKDGTEQTTWPIPEENLGDTYSIDLAENDNLLATASRNLPVSLWQLDTQQVNFINAHTAPVYQVLFTPDNQTLLTAGKDKVIKLWTLDGQLQQDLTGHTADIWGLDISHDGQLIASGSSDSTAILWNLEAGQSILSLVGHQEVVNTVSFSSDRRWLATGSDDDTVILWNIENLSLASFMEQGCNWIMHKESNLNSQMDSKTSSKKYDLCL